MLSTLTSISPLSFVLWGYFFLNFKFGSTLNLFVTIFSSLLGIFSKKAMAPHSRTLAWKIPWTEEPGRLQSVGSLEVGHY